MTDLTPAEKGRRRALRRAPETVAPDAEPDVATTHLPSATALLDLPPGDDHLVGPAADEAPGSTDLSHSDHPVLRPGQAATGDDADQMGARATLRDAFDFGALRRSPYGLTPLLIFGGSSFLQRFDSAAFSLAGPDIALDLDISVSDLIGIQVLVGTFTAFVLVAAGYLADRTRRLPYFGVGTMLSGFFSAVTGRGTSYAGVATPRIIDDAADAAAGVPLLSLFADYYPDEVRGKAFAFLGILGRSGALFAPVLAGYVIATHGWQTGFVVFGIPLFFMGLVALAVLREPVRGYFERKALGMPEEVALQEDEPLSFGEGVRATFAVRTLRRLMVADVFSLAGSGIFNLFLPFFLAERYGLDAFERGLVFIPTIIAGLLGGAIGGSLVDRLTIRNPGRVLVVVGAFSLITAPAYAALALEPPLWLVIAFTSLAGFGGALIGPATSVIYVRTIPATIRTQGIQLTAMAVLPTTILFLPFARNILADWDYEGVFLYTLPLTVVGAIITMTAAGFYELDMRNAFAQAAAKERFRQEKEAGTTKLLVARNVDVHYGDVQVLFDVDLDVQEGEILALLGTNGAGKSTVLRAMCGITQPSGGGIVFDGRDITRMPPHEIAARGIVQMPGGKGVFPGLTVRDNLLLATWLIDTPEEQAEVLGEVFEIFPQLRDMADLRAGDMSGGQQQQLSLAQAFLARPKMLLIDELSLGLAPSVVGQLIEIVKEINRRGVTVVVVEQSVNVALTMADRAIFMEKGEIRFDGPTSELLRRPDILRAVYVKGTGSLTGSAPANRLGADELGAARSILEVRGLTKRYGGVTAVDDVSFALKDGEVLGLIGPNGAGKTTIFEMISGHQRPDGGVVEYDGVDITELSPDARARQGLLRRFQDARLFPSLTVQETMLVALEHKLDVRSSILGAMGAPRVRKAERRIEARADKLLELLELSAHRDKYIKELSTGLRRIVDLACVLAAEPSVLLLDEPSSGIAEAEAEGLGPLLRRVKYETGCAILIIEHDMPLISAVSDELIALDQGQLVTRGTPEEVLNDPRVVESYLGTSEAAINRSGSTT